MGETVIKRDANGIYYMEEISDVEESQADEQVEAIAESQEKLLEEVKDLKEMIVQLPETIRWPELKPKKKA